MNLTKGNLVFAISRQHPMSVGHRQLSRRMCFNHLKFKSHHFMISYRSRMLVMLMMKSPMQGFYFGRGGGRGEGHSTSISPPLGGEPPLMNNPLFKKVSAVRALYSEKFYLSLFNLEWLFTDASHNLV